MNPKLRTMAVLLLSTHAGCGYAADITLNAGEEPEQKAWTQPAAISYINNADSKDAWNIDAALKVTGQAWKTLPVQTFVRGVIQRNTETKKPVENYAAEVGGKFDLYPGEKTWVFGQASIALTDKTNFPDGKADCSVTPLPTACLRQRERTLRPTFTIQPHREPWDRTFATVDSTHDTLVGPSWTRSIVPTLTVFYDDVLDAKLNGVGVEPDGGVLGSKVLLTMAFSPKFTDYHLVLAGSAQWISAFDRSDKRKADFATSSSLFTASATYEFGPRSFEMDSTGWVPSLGVTYTSGDDPLAGKGDLHNVTVGFKITYRSK